MGTEMTLLEVVANLNALDVGDTIYAAEPWTEGSASLVEREPEQGGLPIRAKQRNMMYFLEVELARAVATEWANATGLRDDNGVCKRLIEYATYDA